MTHACIVAMILIHVKIQHKNDRRGKHCNINQVSQPLKDFGTLLFENLTNSLIRN